MPETFSLVEVTEPVYAASAGTVRISVYGLSG